MQRHPLVTSIYIAVIGLFASLSFWSHSRDGGTLPVLRCIEVSHPTSQLGWVNCDIVGCLRHGSSTPESRHSLALQYLSQRARNRLMHRSKQSDHSRTSNGTSRRIPSFSFRRSRGLTSARTAQPTPLSSRSHRSGARLWPSAATSYWTRSSASQAITISANWKRRVLLHGSQPFGRADPIEKVMPAFLPSQSGNSTAAKAPASMRNPRTHKVTSTGPKKTDPLH